MGSDNAANENKEFDETIENTLFSTSSKELLTIDTDAGNYQKNEQISVFKNNPKIQINLKTLIRLNLQKQLLHLNKLIVIVKAT